MKFLSFFGNTLLVLALVLVALLAAATLFPIPGQVQIKIVQSGSMEPTIHVGSIVVIQPQHAYTVGEVVTFGKDTKTHTPTTHRIVGAREEAGVTYFTTKGDANEDADASETSAQDVIGRVLVSVPYAGYLIDFARKPLGFVLLIVIPAGLIVVHEVWSIIEEIRRRGSGGGGTPPKTRKDAADTRIMYTRLSGMDDIYRPRAFTSLSVSFSGASERRIRPLPLLSIGVLFAAALVPAVGSTLSYFGDSEHSDNNLFAAGILDFSVDADAPRAISLSLTGTGEGNGTGVTPFVLKVSGSLPFAYEIDSEVTGGDPVLCDALQLKGSAPLFDYDGPLATLHTGTTTDTSAWPVALYVPDDAAIPDGTVCMVDLIYKGAQEGGDIDDEYHDDERLSLLITYHAPVQFKALSLPEGSVLGESTETGTTSDEGIDEPEEETPPADPVPEEDVPPQDPPPVPDASPSETPTS